MISEELFNNIILKSKKFKYSSMEYVEYEELKYCDLILNNEDIIMLVGKSYYEEHVQIYFASNTVEGLLNSIKKLSQKAYVEFIPQEYITQFKDNKFSIVSEFVDFFNEDIKNTYIGSVDYCNIVLANKNDSEEVSKLLMECQWQSRGFRGETTESINEWLDSEYGEIILVKKDEVIIGVCLVSLYGFDSEKGTILWVREVAVKPRFQGNGYGNTLVEQALCYGIHNKAVRSFLAADVQNSKAICLYKKYGFNRNADRGQINMLEK